MCRNLCKCCIAESIGSNLSFFFSSRRRHTRFDCDWSSDVCSSDLIGHRAIERLSRAAAVPDSGRTVAEARTCAAALRAAVAVRSDAADADAMIARFDSVIRSGPVHRRATFNSPSMLDWELLLLSRLYESRGDDSAALAAVRRWNMWETYPRSPFLTASLRHEGDLRCALAIVKERSVHIAGI